MNERRSLGEIVMQVGQLSERVEVTAEVTPVQTASSERAGLVTGTQLLNTAIRGRDFVSLIATLPGIYDENMQSRDVSKGPGAGGVHINGGRSTSINFALDGVQNTDTGSNGGSHVQPNMDAVAEVKVLTSNYQAEYGRSSAGTINVTTKSGTQNFHGSGYWFYRHEGLYANSFFRNRTGTVRPVERIQNFGYTIGGPVYGRGFNKNKDKLFFFWSQEFVRRRSYPGTQFVTTPTALERAGDFSQTRDVNGAVIADQGSHYRRELPRERDSDSRASTRWARPSSTSSRCRTTRKPIRRCVTRATTAPTSAAPSRGAKTCSASTTTSARR